MAETTVQQMALLRNTEFMERIQATLAQLAPTILSEPGTTPYHPGRAQYAQRFISSPKPIAEQAAPQVVMGVNVIASTTYDEETKTSECDMADIDLQSQILTLWNSLAGLDTPA
jgi:hypothetical protein